MWRNEKEGNLGTSNLGDQLYEEQPATNEYKLYQLGLKTIRGEDVILGNYIDRPCLFVNIAPGCGLSAEEYKILNQIYDKLQPEGLEIFAFPCDNFGNCPDDEAALIDFHELIMKAKFPLMEKISVNPNPDDEEIAPNTSPLDEYPLYKLLKNSTDGDPVFFDYTTKFLVLPGGRVWRFNDRFVFRTLTLEQFIRRKIGVDTDSTATTPLLDSDSDLEKRTTEWAGAELPTFDGLEVRAELGKSYGDKHLEKILKAGRWPLPRADTEEVIDA